jgi:hypothetical protein
MADEPSAAFFAWLDEQPERRGGGWIVSVREVAESRSQLRGAVPQPGRPPRYPEAEKRHNQLKIFAYLIEKDERG